MYLSNFFFKFIIDTSRIRLKKLMLYDFYYFLFVTIDRTFIYPKIASIFEVLF